VTTEKLPDVWLSRDYPVLREACRRIDVGEFAMVWDLEKATGLEAADISRAIAALKRQGFVTGVDQRGAGLFAGITAVSGDAYRVVGLHPDSRTDSTQQLVAALLAAADAAPEVAEKTRLQKAAAVLADVSKDTAAGVVSALLYGVIPH